MSKDRSLRSPCYGQILDPARSNLQPLDVLIVCQAGELAKDSSGPYDGVGKWEVPSLRDLNLSSLSRDIGIDIYYLKVPFDRGFPHPGHFASFFFEAYSVDFMNSDRRGEAAFLSLKL